MIHESENLTSNLKAFRGEDDWLRKFLFDPISLIGVWGYFVLSGVEFSTCDIICTAVGIVG